MRGLVFGMDGWGSAHLPEQEITGIRLCDNEGNGRAQVWNDISFWSRKQTHARLVGRGGALTPHLLYIQSGRLVVEERVENEPVVYYNKG